MRKPALLFGLCLFATLHSFAQEAPTAFSEAISWERSSLPNPPGGWENTTATISTKQLIVVGPNSETPADTIRWIDLNGIASAWTTASPALPQRLQSPALCPTPEGLLILGGRIDGAWSDAAYQWSQDTGLNFMSALPFSPAFPTASALEGDPHLAGFDQTGKLYVWPLEKGEVRLPILDGATLPEGLAPGPIALVRQQDGDGQKVWVVGEGWVAKVDAKSLTASFFTTELSTSAAAMPVGVAHLLVPTETGEHYFFHTITGTWVTGAQPDHAEATWRLFERTGADLFAIVSTDAGTVVSKGAEVRPTPRLSTIDFAVLVGYFIVLLVIGNWFRIRELDTRDYFLGGNRVPGWAAGISIVLTNISAVSLLSIPAKSFATNWTFFIMLLTPLIAAPLVIKFVLPFFFHLRLTTAFEYLEKRFNVWLRCLGSLQYGLYEICRMGVLILLPSIVLSVVTGIDISVCIIVIGVISTLYTLFGGLEAVVWTDVMQGVIMVGGILLAIGIMLFRMDDGIGQLSAIAWPQDKLQMLDWSPNIATVTVWTFLLALPIVLNGYVAHQPTVQRFMCARDIKDAGRALWTTGISAPLILGTLFLCGTTLFLFYGQFPEKLNPTMEQPDQLLAWFIISELPVGMIGLMIAAIFAATMSSLDSGLNSLSSVFVTDFYRRFSSTATDKKALVVAKASTAFIGVLGTGFGLWLATMNVLSLFDAFIEFASLLTGGLAGCFLLGIFTRRANGTGALVGWAMSTLLVYLAKTHGDFQFYLYATIGTVSCFAVGYLVSLCTRPGTTDLTNLTLWTRSSGGRNAHAGVGDSVGHVPAK